MDATEEFISRIAGPLKFRMFLLSKLPSAFFSGIRIQKISAEECITVVPYKWFSRNPFRSTYFACLAMAAEMSTGALAMAHIYKRKPAISLLVTNFEASYFKKATGKTFFTCTEGESIKAAIEKAISTGESSSVKVNTKGEDIHGNLIATAIVTWSFKARK